MSWMIKAFEPAAADHEWKYKFSSSENNYRYRIYTCTRCNMANVIFFDTKEKKLYKHVAAYEAKHQCALRMMQKVCK